MKITRQSKREVNNFSNSKIEKNLSPQSSFLEELQNIDNSDVEILGQITEDLSFADVQNLGGLIEQQGDILLESPTPANFLKYKNYIKVFLKIMKDNHEIKEHIIRQGLTRTKLFKTIESVDQDLQKLGEYILSAEKRKLEILQLTKQITGLIIDIIY